MFSYEAGAHNQKASSKVKCSLKGLHTNTKVLLPQSTEGYSTFLNALNHKEFIDVTKSVKYKLRIKFVLTA